MAMVSPFSALASARVVESVSSVPSLYSFISFGSCETIQLVLCVAISRYWLFADSFALQHSAVRPVVWGSQGGEPPSRQGLAA